MLLTMLSYFVIIIAYAFIYIKYGYNYAKGIAIYNKYNNTPPSAENRFTQPEDCLQSIKNEFWEFYEAVTLYQPYEALLEFADVFHASIKYLVVTFLPKTFYCHYLFWSIIFLVAIPALPATIKLGLRYKKFGCIRNHGNVNNCHHTCDRINRP